MLFEHRYSTTIICLKCQHKHRTTSPDESIFIEFSLQDFRATSGDLQQMILKQSPLMDDNYKCPKCHQKGEKTQIKKLSMIPEILVVLLKKYKEKWVIDAPTELKIPAMDQTSFNYKLVALSEHSGGQAGGHYWARALRHEKNYMLNDTHVSSLLDNLKTNNATYMIWYHFTGNSC